MTIEEENRMFVDHMRRAGDFALDMPLCRWSIARHVRAVGRFNNRFIHLEIGA